MGQSILTALYDAALGSNHAYFDPNVFFQGEEMRKQIESIASALVWTAQESPDSDLFKKMMSADGIAGRRPYGILTTMFFLIGWERMECNKIFCFRY